MKYVIILLLLLIFQGCTTFLAIPDGYDVGMGPLIINGNVTMQDGKPSQFLTLIKKEK